MAIIKYNFINEKYLKIILKKLCEDEYLEMSIVKNLKVYQIKDKEKIKNILKTMENNLIIKNILTIDESTFMVTSLFYEVRNNYGYKFN